MAAWGLGQLEVRASQAAQPFSQGPDLAEDPGVAAAVVINDRAVELLRGPPALPPLEVLDRGRPVGQGLHGGQHVNPWLPQTADLLPVGGAGGGFHQQEGRSFHGADDVVGEGRPPGPGPDLVLPPAPDGIAVPGGDVHHVPELEVVDTLIAFPVIGRHREVGD